ncbi:MAG: hypothetical protein ACI9T7_000629 [Oleiphilaceae bacterium]|jgi:hypothetical protein
MFGFPFVTSLIVVIGLVTAFSFIINKGITLNSKNSKQANLSETVKKSVHSPA